MAYSRPARMRMGLCCCLLLAGCSSPMQRYGGHDPAMAYVPVARAGISDARPPFRALFCAVLAGSSPASRQPCDFWLRRLDDELPAPASVLLKAEKGPHQGPRPFDLLIVSGVFSECLPRVRAFADAVGRFRQLGYAVDYVPVKGRASAIFNADIIYTTVNALRSSQKNRKFVVLAYSKGAIDTLTALERHPELAADIAAVISFAGAVNGSPLADQYRGLYERLFAAIPDQACPVTDGGEIADLTREYRLNWLVSHPVPRQPALFSIVATPTPDRVSRVLLPMHAALSRIDPRNDGQILHFDALLPGATLLGYVNADHFAIALPFVQHMPLLAHTLIDMNDFPRGPLAEAAVLYVEETLLPPAKSPANGQ